MDVGLTERAILSLRSILRQHPEVEKAILFGSRAKGTFKPGSDIDLTLMGSKITHETLKRIVGELDASSLPYDVDISIYRDIQDTELKSHIDRRGILFYQSSSCGQ